jgi:hypothetical protein
MKGWHGMRTFRPYQDLNTRGGALPFALMLLMIMTLMMSSSLKSSLDWGTLVRTKLRSSSLELRIKDHFTNIQQNLTNQISVWMKVRSVCDSNGLTPSACQSQAGTLSSLSFLTVEQRSFVAQAASGVIPQESLNQSYQPIGAENFRWTQSCIENCKTDPNTYPKRFVIQVSAVDLEDRGTEVSASGVIEITQEALSDYSVLALGISGNVTWNLEEDVWPSFPMAFLAAGTHGRVGIFFDNSSLANFAAGNQLLPAASQLPANQIGALRFVTGTSETISIRNLQTNAPMDRIYLDSSGGTGGNGTTGGGGNPSYVAMLGPINAASSPADDVNLSLRATAEQDPNTIRQKDTVTSSTESNCNATDSVVWRRPTLAELKMWCDGSSCQLQMREWRRRSENSTSLRECQRKTYSNSQDFLHNKIIYTSASRVNVIGSGYDGSHDDDDDEDSSSGSSNGAPQFSNANFTIIAEGSFYLNQSPEKKGPAPSGLKLGNVAFVSLSDHALRLTKDFKTLKNNKTLEELASSGLPHSSPNELTVSIPIGAITTAPGKAPIFMDRQLLTNTNLKPLGTIKTEGPLWGYQLSALRMVQQQIQSSSAILTGFSKTETSYPQRWLLAPPPGLNIRTSGMHSSAIASFSITRKTLKSLMAERQVPWVENN